MQKVLVSLPEELVVRMKALIPNRQRSKILAKLLEQEVNKREKALYECACDVESDDNLNNEMKDWETTVGDGIEAESW